MFIYLQPTPKYDRKDIYDTGSFKVFFYNANSEKLDKFIKENNIIVKYYIVNDKKYYVRNIDKLILLYTSEMNSNDKIYYLYNGINIDGVCVNTSVEKLMLFEKEFNIYQLILVLYYYKIIIGEVYEKIVSYIFLCWKFL